MSTPPYLRQFRADEVEAYRALRLEALRLEPGSFCSSYARESAFTAQEWNDRLCNPNSATYGLYDGPELVGVTAIFIDPRQPDTGQLVQDYIRRSHRARGLTRLFYQQRIAWARERGLKRLIVGYREDNAASLGGGLREGFEPSHRESQSWPDGLVADCCYYRLQL